MNKILIIGQAPPAVKQEYPYDTTLLYSMFEWIGVNKLEAQNLFEFEALVDKFPGRSLTGGHLSPKKSEMIEYYQKKLKTKILIANKIILLGNPARDFLQPTINSYSINGRYLFLPHPSKRNYNLIMINKKKIINLLKEFVI